MVNDHYRTFEGNQTPRNGVAKRVVVAIEVGCCRCNPVSQCGPWSTALPIDPSAAFVSYSREDLEFILRLTKDLKARGAKVWMDKVDIRAGQVWEQAIEDAVRVCRRMIVVLSPASVNSKRVKVEVSSAFDEDKEIIPVLLRDCEIPRSLRLFQYADFRSSYDEGLEELLASLNSEQQPAAASAGAPAAISTSPAISERETLPSARAPLTLRGHTESVESVAWSPDGKQLATGSGDKTAKVWNADGA